ncbi:MAG: helix-turn-helix domain-containing protein [Paeniclostridium sp.]|nr:helix-turn-helix domain-containing protein [Paeniclostridium sp.]MBS6024987.1 helix-turn-helix domain-containing protein [Paeniclostridium sordellii]MBW4864210.1 helix-turn-helix domain-containing protein [Paeniclostridium sp.]MBW4873713.1 helix-turn-helix domain-containing protein [Paeniclostridium sp.]
METLASRLKFLRKEKGYTLEQMANDLNTTKVTLSRYENGTREPKSETLNQLSDYFNVSIDYLFGKTDERTAPTKSEIIDVKKAIDEIKSELERGDSLMFDGECLSEDAISSLLSAMEIGLSMAKKKQEEIKNK